MNLTDEQLTELQRFAGLFFNVEQIAIVLQVDAIELAEELANTQSEAHKAFWKGRLMEEARQREVVFNLSAGGSAPAQNLAMQLMERAKLQD